jgi:hypothetical protein
MKDLRQHGLMPKVVVFVSPNEAGHRGAVGNVAEQMKKTGVQLTFKQAASELGKISQVTDPGEIPGIHTMKNGLKSIATAVRGLMGCDASYVTDPGKIPGVHTMENGEESKSTTERGMADGKATRQSGDRSRENSWRPHNDERVGINGACCTR